MLDKTITAALLHLRAQIVRDGLDGLPHVDALLVSRGVDPAAHRVPRKFAQRQDTSRLALEALRTGPKRGYEVAQYAAQATGEHLPDQWRRMYRALHNLRRRGLVAKEERVWRLAPQAGSPIGTEG